MKVLVTGVCGQLGHDVINELAGRGHIVIGTDMTENYTGIQDGTAVTNAEYVSLDITDEEKVMAVISEIKPDVVIHPAAWTAVDAAEDEENIEKVNLVNGKGPEYIAKACKKNDCKMIHISTDYVFDGQGNEPWEEDCKEFGPLSVYGQSKLNGELAVSETLSKYFVVRIAWVFGINGNNFVKTMLRVGKNRDKLTVVNDQIGTPTYTLDLARILADMAESEKYGFYHVTNEGGYISWYDFAKAIFKKACEMGYEEYSEDNLKVIPVTTKEYGVSKAARPFNSRLVKDKLIKNGFTPLPTWEDALSRYLKEIEI